MPLNPRPAVHTGLLQRRCLQVKWNTPPPKGVRSMSSLTAEYAGSDSGLEQEVTKKGVRLVLIAFARIRQFQGQPFRLYTGERFSDMVETIRQNGILMPLIVRRVFESVGCDYEMLSGHNRMNAGQAAGLEGAWCVVKEGLSDVEAMMYVVETNLLQRYVILEGSSRGGAGAPPPDFMLFKRPSPWPSPPAPGRSPPWRSPAAAAAAGCPPRR